MHKDLQADLIAPPSLLTHLLPSPLNIHLQNLPTNLIDLDTLDRHRSSVNHHHEIILHAPGFQIRDIQPQNTQRFERDPRSKPAVVFDVDVAAAEVG